MLTPNASSTPTTWWAGFGVQLVDAETCWMFFYDSPINFLFYYCLFVLLHSTAPQMATYWLENAIYVGKYNLNQCRKISLVSNPMHCLLDCCGIARAETKVRWKQLRKLSYTLPKAFSRNHRWFHSCFLFFYKSCSRELLNVGVRNYTALDNWISRGYTSKGLHKWLIGSLPFLLFIRFPRTVKIPN